MLRSEERARIVQSDEDYHLSDDENAAEVALLPTYESIDIATVHGVLPSSQLCLFYLSLQNKNPNVGLMRFFLLLLLSWRRCLA